MTADRWALVETERGYETYDLIVEYTVTSWGDPGRFSGPPEVCWPPEAPEIDIELVSVKAPAWALGKYPNDRIVMVLTRAERNWLYEEIVSGVNQYIDRGPDPDYARDRMLDDGPQYDDGGDDF